MDAIKTILQDYGIQILGAVLTAVASYLGIVFKKLYTKIVNDKTKETIAKIVVQGVEQCYKELKGPEKLEKAITTASEMLAEKGITVTELEIRMLLESAVGEFNKVFEKN